VKQFFCLFACCIPVKGAKRSIICDLQRDRYQPIPTILYYMLTRYRNHRVNDIKAVFDNQHDDDIDSYFAFLEENELGFWTDSPQHFTHIDLSQWHEAKTITNAIIDYSPESTHHLAQIVPQLSALGCDALEIRYYHSLTLTQLTESLEAVKGSTLRSAEVVVGYHPSLTPVTLRELHQHNPRVRKLTIHSAGSNEFIEAAELVIILTTEVVDSEQCCGTVNPWYFTSSTHVFAEAKQFNSCLNRKVSVDKHGFIKNCPSMSTSFGHVDSTALAEVVRQELFAQVWDVNKDQVEVCRDCEFRYICQDCRAYTQDNASAFAKPAKCSYNPYDGVWQ
jgi:SPASM domain peptide maturase of grasp-with-spasm system